MYVEILLTITAALVLANLINRVLIHPMLASFFGVSSKSKGRWSSLDGSASSSILSAKSDVQQ